jgi:hypothetical protein
MRLHRHGARHLRIGTVLTRSSRGWLFEGADDGAANQHGIASGTSVLARCYAAGQATDSFSIGFTR